MSQSPVTWRSSKITFVVTATWASISTLKYIFKYRGHWIRYLRLSRSNFFVFSTESRTDCRWWNWISFCWSSSAASGCWWSCWSWWSVHFLKSEKNWVRFGLDMCGYGLVNCSRKIDKFNRVKSRNGLVCQDRFLAELNYLISEQKNQDSQIFNQLWTKLRIELYCTTLKSRLFVRKTLPIWLSWLYKFHFKWSFGWTKISIQEL